MPISPILRSTRWAHAPEPLLPNASRDVAIAVDLSRRTDACHFAYPDREENGRALARKLEGVSVPACDDTVPPRFSSLVAAAARKLGNRKPRTRQSLPMWAHHARAYDRPRSIPI